MLRLARSMTGGLGGTVLSPLSHKDRPPLFWLRTDGGEEGGEGVRSVGAVGGDDVDEGRSDDDSVGVGQDFLDLVGGGDSEADRDGYVGDFADFGDDGGEVGAEFGAYTCDSEGTHEVDETFGLGSDHAYTGVGGGGDHGDEADSG